MLVPLTLPLSSNRSSTPLLVRPSLASPLILSSISAGNSTGDNLPSGPHALTTPSGNLSSSVFTTPIPGPSPGKAPLLTPESSLPLPLPVPIPRRLLQNNHTPQTTSNPTTPSPTPKPMVSALVSDPAPPLGGEGGAVGAGAAWMTSKEDESA